MVLHTCNSSILKEEIGGWKIPGQELVKKEREREREGERDEGRKERGREGGREGGKKGEGEKKTCKTETCFSSFPLTHLRYGLTEVSMSPGKIHTSIFTLVVQ
jgi:hypothetical protein